MDAFKLLISETPGNLKFCFFIDGVDEYEGDCWEIAEYFYDLSTSKHVKFCLSSRPETGLLETFGKMPQLRLQDLTALDISIYVQDKLESNSQMQSLMESNLEGVSHLIKQVVLNGNGIFLWIKLVVKSLLSGLRKRDDIAVLWARLHEMPKELDDLYGHMLSSIDPRHMIEASKLFQMASGHPLASYSIGVAYACYMLNLKSFEKAISDDELSACFRTPPDNYREDFSHILCTRCGGLLELSGLSEKMIYIHRTAHEYIKKPQTWQALLDHTADLEFDTNFTFPAMLLQTVKSYTNNDSSKWIDMGSLRLIWTYIPRVISGIESTRAKRHILALVEEFDKAGQSLLEFFMPPDRQVKHWSNFDYQYGIEIYLSNMTRFYGCDSDGTSNPWHIADLLSACVHNDFELYVKMKIVSEPQLMEGTYDPPLAALTFLRHSEDSGMNLRLLVFLLKHNAELNDIYFGHSLWRMWLHLVHAKVSKRPKGYIAHQMGHVYLVMEITIRRGTDLDTCCLTCLEEDVTFSRIYQDHNYTKRLQKHGKPKHSGRPLLDPSNASNSEDLTDSEEANASKSQQEPWEARHSLEQIIKDIFDEEHSNLALKLLTLVAEKRAEKAAIEKQARNELSCRKKGRKQKQKNKKGRGKREMTAQASDDFD